MTNEIITITSKKSFPFSPKVLTWTIFSYLGALVFIGFGVWSLYYFSMPNNASDFINKLKNAGMDSFANFVNAWQYTFFPWCLLGLTCVIFAVTGTFKLKNTSVGKPKKKNNKKRFGF